jgi:hypothetical protein
MPEIRIRDGLPCKGVSLPKRHVEAGRWYEVDDETAAYAATVRLHPTSVTSPLVFEVRGAAADPAKAEGGQAEQPAPVEAAAAEQVPAKQAEEPTSDDGADADASAGAEAASSQESTESATADSAGETAATEPEPKPATPERRRRGAAADPAKAEGGK